MPDEALTFEQYLAGLPPERRGEVERVWRVVRESVPGGYVEEIGPKFLTFKGGGEWYVALANQKNYVSLYLMPLYVFPAMKEKLDAAAKNLKCGKGCVNFKRADELPLGVVAEILAANDPETYARACAASKAQARKKKR